MNKLAILTLTASALIPASALAQTVTPPEPWQGVPPAQLKVPAQPAPTTTPTPAPAPPGVTWQRPATTPPIARTVPTAPVPVAPPAARPAPAPVAKAPAPTAPVPAAPPAARVAPTPAPVAKAPAVRPPVAAPMPAPPARMAPAPAPVARAPMPAPAAPHAQHRRMAPPPPPPPPPPPIARAPMSPPHARPAPHAEHHGGRVVHRERRYDYPGMAPGHGGYPHPHGGAWEYDERDVPAYVDRRGYPPMEEDYALGYDDGYAEDGYYPEDYGYEEGYAGYGYGAAYGHPGYIYVPGGMITETITTTTPATVTEHTYYEDAPAPRGKRLRR